MERLSLKAAKRTIFGRKAKKLRKEGLVLANIYGKKIKSQAIQVNEKDFDAVYSKTGETSLIDLMFDGEKRPVLIHNIQFHPVSHVPLHADFFQVDLKEKVTAKVPVVLTGEAVAVKDKIGVLLTLVSEIEVEALPQDLVDKVEVDVVALSAVGQSVKVSAIKISDKVRIINSPEQELVKVAPLVSKEAEKMAAEEAAAQAAAAAAATEEAATTETTEETPQAASGTQTESSGNVKEETKKP